MEDTILVTGGAGFIGSNFILQWISEVGTPVINLDKLTYAGNLRNLEQISSDRRYQFVQGNVIDRVLLRDLFQSHRPRAVLHFAAESHVDRSIRGPDDFIRTNVNGTFSLLEEARAYWLSLREDERQTFRFLHISTDEVYGSLAPADPSFSEQTGYAPNSPYSASKAAADHLVRAYHQTYGLPTLTTNCSNNYGPYQFPEKLIPLFICNLLRDEPVPVYGDGLQVRDWIHVRDHCAAVHRVWRAGRLGEVYNIGGRCERNNLELTHKLLEIMGKPKSLIRYVKDRPGHDRRYAIDCSKIERELEWRPTIGFDQGLRDTVKWYEQHADWVANIRTGEYLKYYERHYGK